MLEENRSSVQRRPGADQAQHSETRADLSTAKSTLVERILNALVSANPT